MVGSVSYRAVNTTRGARDEEWRKQLKENVRRKDVRSRLVRATVVMGKDGFWQEFRACYRVGKALVVSCL